MFYAPHAGYPVAHRLRYYKELWMAWKEFCARHPNKWKVLTGDGNLPGLFDGGKLKKREQLGTAESYFASTFLANMVMANCAGGVKAEATYKSGSVLDVLLFDPPLSRSFFRVHRIGIAGSDHSMITAGFRSPAFSRPLPELRWSFFRDADWRAIEEKVEPTWWSWLSWFRECVSKTSLDNRSNMLSDAVALL